LRKTQKKRASALFKPATKVAGWLAPS